MNRPTARGRNTQVDRVLKILRDLCRVDGASLYDLADAHGVSLRTIRRDLDALQQVGLALTREIDPDGKKIRYHFNPGAERLGAVAGLLDANHYLALTVAMNDGGSVARETLLHAALEDLAEKIEQAVGPKGRAQLEALSRCFLAWDKHAYREASRDHLWALVRAIQERRLCRIRYRAASTGGVERSYMLLPLRLFVHDRAVYLLCQFQGHREVGTLNLHRLMHLRVTGEVGEPPEDFDADRWAESAFTLQPGDRPTTYVLRFTPDAAPYIRERLWHPSQALRELPGGGLELRFRCGESPEVTNWIVGWGEWVKVVEPQELRARLGALGTWLAETYRSQNRLCR